MRFAVLAVVLAIVVVGACGGDDTTPCDSHVASAGPPVTATTHAIVELDPEPTRVVYALSDIHGGYDRFAALLAGNHVIDGVPKTPAEVAWAAGDAILVVAGDLIDKGPQPVEVIDSLRALETGAAAKGGQVVVLLGNHEVEFFADPSNSKASGKDGFNKELAAENIDCGKVAAGVDERGAWLRDRPLGARVGKWFFSHAGNTKGRSVADLDKTLRDALNEASPFGGSEMVGDDSIVEARGWYGNPDVTKANATALGVAHFVFGHDPNALGARGSIATAQDGQLFRIDCGMSPDVDDSSGCILRIRHDGADVVAEQLKSDGSTENLFRGQN